MYNILIINTGGTFNKYYNSIDGKLKIDKTSKAIKKILDNWLCEFKIINIINKDSLDFNDEDRILLGQTITDTSKDTKIVVVHGTDTMELSAKVLAELNLPHTIVFTGAMVPFEINPIEATANLSSAIGYLQNENAFGISIAMNGLVVPYNSITKDKKNGRFIIKRV